MYPYFLSLNFYPLKFTSLTKRIMDSFCVGNSFIFSPFCLTFYAFPQTPDHASYASQTGTPALSPMHIRLGGTLQDQIVYDVGSPAQPCLPLVKDDAHMFGFRGGCLPMERWSALNALFARTGYKLLQCPMSQCMSGLHSEKVSLQKDYETAKEALGHD